MSDAPPQLLPQHLADLRRSGLSDETIAACRFRSISDPKSIRRILGWDAAKAGIGACLGIPFPSPDGQLNGYARLKPDKPRTSPKDGSPVKYESPKGKRNHAYFPPGTWAALQNAEVPLLITEGEKKAAKADQEGFPTIGLVGVYGWQKKRENKDSPRELIPDLEGVAWQGRTVLLVYDSDAATKRTVAFAEWHLAVVLTAKGATVRVVRLPAAADSSKVGLDDFLVAHGADAFRQLLDTAEVPKEPEDDRPEVLLSTMEFLAIDQAIKALADRDKKLFQRGGELVRIARPLCPAQQRRLMTSGSPKIESLPAPTLRARLTRFAQVLEFQQTKEGPRKVPAHPTKWLIEGISNADGWPGVRPLEAVVTTPVLLPDGTVLQRPGYHADSGLLYEANDDYPPIPERPSLDDARRAIDTLLEVVCNFPFQRPEHRSAWLAGTLTPIGRFAFDGPSPLYLADANVRGAGKGLLLDSSSWIAMGREFARSPYTLDDTEMSKTITAIAHAGERMILFDNLGGFLGNPSLDAALTSTEWQGRILSTSKQPRVPLLTTWYGTGNNVVLLADTTRRVCPIRLQSPDERPEDRSDFRYPDLLAWVREHRCRLLSAALTVLSAYCKAGRPDQRLKPWGSYEGWSALVRGAIVWAGQPDPGLAREELLAQSDMESLRLRAVIAGWQEIDPDGEGKTAAGALTLLKETTESGAYPTLREALAEQFDLPQGKLPTAHKLGNRLNRWRGRNVGGLCFDSKPSHGGIKLWFVRGLNGRSTNPADGGTGGTPTETDPANRGLGGEVSGTGGTGGTETTPLTRVRAGARAEIEPWENSPTSPTSPTRTDALDHGTPFQVITDAAELPPVLQALDESERVGLDSETTGLSPHRDRVRLLQLATDRGVFLLDSFTLGDSLSLLWEPLAEREVIVHNAAFDLAFLWRLGFRPGKVTDLMILSRLLTAGTRTANGLEDLASRELGVTLDKTFQKANWSGALSLEQLRYAALDAKVTRDLYAPLTAKIIEAGLEVVAAIENRAVPAFVWLACSGAPFDAEAWAAVAAEAKERERSIVERLDAAAPHREGCFGAGAWNWNSPQDVTEAFAALGFTLDSTNDATLAGVDHPLAAALREHRSAAQMVKTFGRSWLDFADGGRIYAGWVQLGTDAGRSSCKKPNLQQVPKDAPYRRCFRAPEGRVLVKADYSQLQLRIACKVAQERRMLAAYRNGEDLHTLTAKSITGKSEVTKADRQTAKAVNFGLLFGLGAKGLRSYAAAEYGLELTPAEAEQYRRRFFETYPALKCWHNREGQSNAGECQTLLGRRRLLDSKTPYTHRLNSPVQGSEADGAKLAMALLWERREQCPGAFPVLFVHDEIVVEADADKADAAAEWLKQAMIDGMKDMLAPVPCEVEAQIAQTWGGWSSGVYKV
jgi:DNA polymerase I-like protein with 3'-5' exonuclease and polymerase domains